MYGRTIDDFEYRGVTFRWVLSPNKLIYRVYHESDLIGTIPVSQVRLRHSREAIKALYPICDAWMEKEGLKQKEDAEGARVVADEVIMKRPKVPPKPKTKRRARKVA